MTDMEAGTAAARAALAEALRRVQDAVAGARPTQEVARQVAADLDLAHAALEGWVTSPDGSGPSSYRHSVVQEQTLVPEFTLTESGGGRLRGTTRFRRFHLGGGAVHGGVLPLLFDDVLGRLASSLDGPPARTAHLRVDFRNITPIDVDLRVEAAVDRVEGRKRFLTGRLCREDTVLAEVQGLWVELRPGQP